MTVHVVHDEQVAHGNDGDNAGDYNAVDWFSDNSAGNSDARDNDDKDDYDASEDGAQQMPQLTKTAGRLKRILLSF